MNKQKYLAGLKKMQEAMECITKEASEMNGEESLYMADAYPFVESFDEVLLNVHIWIEQQNKRFGGNKNV